MAADPSAAAERRRAAHSKSWAKELAYYEKLKSHFEQRGRDDLAQRVAVTIQKHRAEQKG